MTENRNLFEQLHNYGQSDYYPYHMPGHKRRQLGSMPQQLLKADITEIDGFDNLHQPEGILLDLQKQAATLYGADETYYLVNGSTCGILSAVSAVLPEGGHLLMARGCHKSAYHAVYLRKLRVTYLYAKQLAEFDFQEAITASQVEEALEREPDIGAVLIVSPTYEGRIADIAAIARVVHKRGIPLIVDEAHGAHLGFASGWAPNSCKQGADLVIHSVHKTLPSMTQTALLHVNGTLVDRLRLRRFLHIYQTSSPSYILMASIGDAMEVMRKQGAELLEQFRQNYLDMCKKLQQCRQLKFIPYEDVVSTKHDMGKLIISTGNAGVSGQWLYDTLREQYHLQCEMSAGSYCLAMFTLADIKEGYERMTQALLEIDELIVQKKTDSMEVCEWKPVHYPLQEPQIVCSLAECWEQEWELTEVSCAINKTVADFINLYPPGIPLLVPGEVLTQELYEQLCEYMALKLNIQGIVEKDNQILIPTLK